MELRELVWTFVHLHLVGANLRNEAREEGYKVGKEEDLRSNI